MLENIKKASDHFIFKLLLGVLIVSFAFTGIYGYISSTNDDYVAKIGSNEYISTDLFIKTKRRKIQEIKTNYPQITEEQLSFFNVNQNIIQSLVFKKLIELEANALGIKISDEIVAQEISKNKIFHNKQGKFDPLLFKAILRNSNIFESDYVNDLKKDIATNIMLNVFLKNWNHPESLNKLLALYQKEKRKALIVTSNVKTAYTPNTNEIKKFYEAHISDFSTPETRDVEYIYVQPSHFKSQIKLSDKEKNDAIAHLKKDKNFEQNKKNILMQLEFQKIDQKMIETIQEIEDEVASDESLEKLAKRYKVGFGKLSKVSRKTTKLPEFASFKEELFKADLNQPSETIQIDREKPGYYIINITKINSPSPIPLNENISSKISKFLIQEKQIHKNHEAVSKALIEYKSHKDTKKLKNVTFKSKEFARPGQDSNRPGTKQEAIIQIFNIKPKETTEVFVNNDNQYSFMILEKIIKAKDANKKELANAKSIIESNITLSQQNQFIDYLENKYPVKIRTDLLKKL